MIHISILSSSVRTGRNSHRIALFFKKYIEENKLATAEIVDLMNYRFPLFEERLRFQPHPSVEALAFASKVKTSDGIIIVTPEYNGGYPASLKNVIDLLYDEWYKKPVAISTVSAGNMGGSQVLISLQFTLWKMKAWVVPVQFPISTVQKVVDEEGNAVDISNMSKKADQFLSELVWCIKAKQKMEIQKHSIF